MWEIQIFVDYKQGWKALRPTDGKPYEFKTKEEAIHMANICYPDSLGENIKITER